jgi:hypothetical protein
MTSPTVDLCFRYTARDYVRAMRAHYASKLRLWLDIPAIVIASAAAVYLWRSPSSHWLSILLIGVSAFMVLMLTTAFFIIPPLAFRREPKFKDEYALTFSPESIHFKTENFDSVLQWSIYSRALIDAHSYVLYYGVGSISVIPKRVFQSIDQQRDFERLLRQHIRKIIAK